MSKWADLPKAGDEIYVNTAVYISRGADDVIGGLATVERVEERPDWGEHNRIWVYVKEVPGRGYNWKCLLPDQAKLKAEFGARRAYPDPDLDPRANTGAL